MHSKINRVLFISRRLKKTTFSFLCVLCIGSLSWAEQKQKPLNKVSPEEITPATVLTWPITPIGGCFPQRNIPTVIIGNRVYVEELSKWDNRKLWLHDGLVSFVVREKTGFCDRDGIIKIPAKFEYVQNFSDGMAALAKGAKYGYINTLGQITIQPQFDWGYDFVGGLAPVNIDNKWGIINKTGKWIQKPIYKTAESHKDYGIWVETFEGKRGEINPEGLFVESPR
jgi:hypothetical protein